LLNLETKSKEVFLVCRTNFMHSII